jgi:hypothetical protein
MEEIMAKDIEKVEIDGVTYLFGHLGMKQNIKLLTKLIKLVGAPAMKAKGTGEDYFMDAIGVLMAGLDEDNILNIVRESLSEVVALGESAPNGKLSEHFDTYFRTYGIVHLFKVVKQSLEVLYGDFFEENGILAGISSKLNTPN